MIKQDVIVSFSGGRTSGYMCELLLKYYSHLYNLYFIYANTGQEHEETLIFVNQCDKNFNLNLIWVEAKVDPRKGKGTNYTIVDFKSASRKGEPFEEVIKKYGLPNGDYPHCTRELKLQPMKAWAKDNNLTNALWALGIRNDELKRKKKHKNIIYPLIDFEPTDKKNDSVMVETTNI